MSENKPPEKWYFKTSTFITALLFVGPLALPLAWINPRFSLKTKIIISVVVGVLTYYFGVLVAQSLKSIKGYYQGIL